MRVVLLILLLGLPLWAQPAGQLPLIKLSEMYRLAGPDLGCQLLQPDAVLALMGYSGRADNPLLRGDPKDLQARLDVLNQQFKPMGVSFSLMESWVAGAAGLRISCLAGTERVTLNAPAQLKIFPFRSQSGWEGFSAWEGLQEAQALRHQSISGKNPFVSRLSSLLLGIPGSVVAHRKEVDNVWAASEGSDRLECLYSQYEVPLELAEDPTILNDQEQRGKLLKAVYSDPVIQAIIDSQEFREARRRVLVQVKEYPDPGWWSDERGQLGLWDQASWERMRQLRAERLNLRQFAVLKSHLGELCGSAEKGAALNQLQELCADPMISAGSVQSFALLGESQRSGPFSEMWRAAQKGRCSWLHEGDARAAFERAESFFGQDDYQSAFQSYRKAFLFDPSNVRALIYQGDCQYRMGNLGAAEQLFRQAVALAPKDPLGHRFLAKMLELRFQSSSKRELLQEALRESQAAVRLEPGNSEAQKQLKRIKAQLRLPGQK